MTHTTSFTGVTFMDETITINIDDMVLIDGVECNITHICEDGTFFASSADGDEDQYEIDDIG